MKRTNSISDVRAAIAQGFTTKVAKKEAGRGLEVELGLLNGAAKDAGLAWNEYALAPHQISKAALAAYDRVGLGNWAREIKAARKELGDAPVVPAAKKVDDTKVRDAAKGDPLQYVDHVGDTRGVCWCCGRSGFKLNAQGRLSRHGYQRPGWGYDVGGCQGSGLTPRMTIDRAIEWCEQTVASMGELLGDADRLAALEIRGLRREVRAAHRGTIRGSHTRDSVARSLRGIRAQGATPNFVTKIERERGQIADHLELAREVLGMHLAAQA